MPQPAIPRSYTTLAVADAVLHYRQIASLTRDELSYLLSGLDHTLDADDLRAIENGESIITVDDLMALAVALGVTPTDLLVFIPIQHPGETPLATALPSDVDQPELRAWVRGDTALDSDSRLTWSEDRVARVRVLATHWEDQYRGAQAELDDLGELALQEADALQVLALHGRIHDSEREKIQADIALAYAELRLSQLQVGR